MEKQSPYQAAVVASSGVRVNPLGPADVPRRRSFRRGSLSQSSSPVIRQRIEVRFEVRFDYDVVFTRDALSASNPALRDLLRAAGTDAPHRVLAVVDAGLAEHWPTLDTQLHAYADAHADTMQLVAIERMVGGEAAKQARAHVDAVRAALHRHAIDRHAFVLILGGGAVLDAAGYAAATTHRGVRVVRMPSTVLAQNDAGVGVKNGVNAFGLKNFVGSFAPPFAVLCDEALLQTLSPRDKRAGIAEAVKVALVRDAGFFDALEADVAALAAFEPAAMGRMVRRAAEHHLAHIAGGGDPFEMGNARPLDFGHWSAHKLEALSEHGLRHGEAVAIGMALDCCYATELGLLAADARDRVLALLSGLGFSLWHAALDACEADGKRCVLAGLEEFREHLGGRLAIPMLRAVGDADEVGEVDEGMLLAALRRLRACTPDANGRAGAQD